MAKLGDLLPVGNSVGLTKLGDKPFTVKQTQDSEYDGNPSLIIETVEMHDIDGAKHNRFHTQRVAVMEKLKNSKVQEVLERGETVGPVKCTASMTKSGKQFFVLEDA